MDTFDEWLCGELSKLQTDEVTFCGYIKGILEEDEDWDERIKGIEEILQELGAPDVPSFIDNISKRWEKLKTSSGPNSAIQSEECDTKKSASAGANTQLDDLLKYACTVENAQVNSVSKPEKDSKLRDAIMAHLGSDSSGDEDTDHTNKPGTSGASENRKAGAAGLAPVSDIGRNANIEKVLNEQKKLKEESRAEHLKKKERDKEDRAKQKAAAQERKDKAKKKSSKVERKR